MWFNVSNLLTNNHVSNALNTKHSERPYRTMFRGIWAIMSSCSQGYLQPNEEVFKMGDARRSYSSMKLLGIEGKKCNIIPTTKGMNLTEIYSKREYIDTGYIGAILFDKKWKKYVLVDLHKDMQMSLDCLKEAFEMTKEYWDKHK